MTSFAPLGVTVGEVGRFARAGEGHGAIKSFERRNGKHKGGRLACRNRGIRGSREDRRSGLLCVDRGDGGEQAVVLVVQPGGDVQRVGIAGPLASNSSSHNEVLVMTLPWASCS